MAAAVDPMIYDKNYCQYMGYKYINSNEFESGVESLLTDCIEQLHFAGSSTSAGPKCSCAPGKTRVKCIAKTCALRQQLIECPAECGSNCQNQTLSMRNLPTSIRIVAVPEYGTTVKTTRRIKKNSAVLEYVGLVRMGKINRRQLYGYPLTRFTGEVPMHVDSKRQGNESRLIAHSFEPNCRMEEWLVGKQVRLLVVAERDIEADEVLSIMFPQRKVDLGDWPISGDVEEEQQVSDNEAVPLKNKPKYGRDPIKYKNRKDKETILYAVEVQRSKKRKGRYASIPYTCMVNRCNYRYATEEELLEHHEREHGAEIPPPYRPKSG